MNTRNYKLNSQTHSPSSKRLYESDKCIKKRDTGITCRKPSDTSLKKYALTTEKILEAREVSKNIVFLCNKFYTKKQKDTKFILGTKIKLNEKYKIMNTDLRKRLYVESPYDEIKTLIDIDEGFFQYLNNHHSTQYCPQYKSLKFQFHKLLRIRHESGYRKDCFMSIEQNYRRELKTYERSLKRYSEQEKIIGEFISDDYERSMVLLEKCQKLSANLAEVVHHRQVYANEQYLTQSRLIGLFYVYIRHQKYGRFLYYLSPPSWRADHRTFAHSVEIEAKGFDLGTSSEEDTFNVIFETMKNECASGLIEPVLYFSCPDLLMSLFESLETQQLHHFTYVTYLTPLGKTLKKNITTLRNFAKQDTEMVAHIIEDFKTLVQFCEERREHLRAKFMNILHGLFYDTVAGTDVLKLQMNLEFCYENVYPEKPVNMSLVTTAKALESFYMECAFKLESITNETIKLAIKECAKGEKMTMKRAHNAAKELRLFERLQRSLFHTFDRRNISSLARVKRYPTCKTKRYSCIPVEKVSVTEREFTEAEIDYLRLFTDWMENEDPAKYLQSI